MMHVHIGHHFFGAGNIGDDWMLAGFLAAVAHRQHDLRLTCCIPHNREAMRLRFPGIEWLGYDPGMRARSIADADAWLGLGGTPFQVDSGGWFTAHLTEELELCRQAATPVYFLGVGVESEQSVEAAAARRFIEHAARIWARDPFSAGHLVRASERQDAIITSADLAHVYFDSLPQVPQSAAARFGMVVNVERPEQVDFAVLAAFIASQEPLSVRWIAQEARSLEVSETRIWGAFDANTRARAPLASPEYAFGSLESFLSLYRGLGSLLSTRYHSALAAAWLGTAVSVFERSPKIAGIAEQLQLSRCRDLLHVDEIDAARRGARPVPLERLRGLAAAARASCEEFLGCLGC